MENELTVEIKPVKPLKAEHHPNALLDNKDGRFAGVLNRTRETDFLMDYGVKWDREKCVRDIFQNFSDSHGQTLDGVKVSVKHNTPEGKYRIRIEGQGEYSYELVEQVGASTKQANMNYAGGFGEGLKIAPLVLLRDHGASSVTVSSRNWAYHFLPGKTDEGEDVLCSKLETVPDRQGNYFEIETKDPALVKSFFEGVNFFRHSYNPDFHEPTIENDAGGLKILTKKDSGNIYIAGQRYQAQTHIDTPFLWEGGVKNMHIWINERLEEHDRDRSAIRASQSEKILENFLKKSTDQQLIQIMYELKPDWEIPVDFDEKGELISPSDNKINLLDSVVHEMLTRRISPEFPQKSVAWPEKKLDVGKTEFLKKLKTYGYHFYPTSFKHLGLDTFEEMLRRYGAFDAIEPTQVQIFKVNILKKAVQLLANHSSSDEYTNGHGKWGLAKSVRLFDRLKGEDYNQNILGIHSSDDNVWLDISHLNTGDFETVLATYLHEVTHVYGTDNSAAFHFKLSDWLAILQEVFAYNPQVARDFDTLKQCWQAPEQYMKHEMTTGVVA